MALTSPSPRGGSGFSHFTTHFPSSGCPAGSCGFPSWSLAALPPALMFCKPERWHQPSGFRSQIPEPRQRTRRGDGGSGKPGSLLCPLEFTRKSRLIPWGNAHSSAHEMYDLHRLHWGGVHYLATGRSRGTEAARSLPCPALTKLKSLGKDQVSPCGATWFPGCTVEELCRRTDNAVSTLTKWSRVTNSQAGEGCRAPGWAG